MIAYFHLRQVQHERNCDIDVLEGLVSDLVRWWSHCFSQLAALRSCLSSHTVHWEAVEFLNEVFFKIFK